MALEVLIHMISATDVFVVLAIVGGGILVLTWLAHKRQTATSKRRGKQFDIHRTDYLHPNDRWGS